MKLKLFVYEIRFNNYIMIIPYDTIYLISNYNCDIKDSIKLSLLNREINDNSNRIVLNNPLITYENFHIMSKYDIKKITMKWNFNQPITLPNGLTQITFGYSFNQPINLPNSLTHLIFGINFNWSINLPNGLTFLFFGWNFDQPIILPNSLTYLTFGFHFNQSIILPDSLTHLTFGYYFNQPIILPDSINYLKFGRDFNKSITTSKKFKQNIIPPELRYLIICN